MRSSNIHRNGSSISRMIIREENDNEEETMHRDRNYHHPRLAPAVHFSKTSIIRTHHGQYGWIIN
jgi:phosphoribosylaminoimidazole (AIR) synthetase